MAVSTNVNSPQTDVGLAAELGRRFRSNIQTYTIILALVAIWILFAVLTNGAFFSAQNVSNLFRQMTVTSFLAIGMVFVIVTGNIDLSVGKLAGFVSVVAAYFQANVWYQLIPNMPLVAAMLSVIIGVGVGIIWGVLQGYIIAYLNVPAFIVTLGSMFVLNGAILLVTQGRTIPANQPYFSEIAQGYLPPTAGWAIAAVVVVFLFWNMVRSRQSKRRHGFQLPNIALDIVTTIFYAALVIGYVYWVNQYRGIQTPVLLLAITAAIMAYVSNNTRFGRYAYAIGGNREAARLSGINIRRSIFLIFILMGLLSGIAGIVLASYVGYGTTAAGQGYELDAIASAILGGTSTLGGVGTVFGALIGSLIMASLTTGLQMLNVAPAWQYVVKGGVLVLAVFADVYFKRNR
ncbi:MAG: xylose ABC transporter permease [Chloroflexota bacterium]|jgi:D-xylose transport system permease protein|nr:sugar ABC transporter permease [Caldilinea sp.]GIK73459.1 MAG: xylose ABC transporter permease [Chloroflexota bacterium]